MTKQFSTRLPEEISKKLKKLSDETDIPQARLVVRALKDLFKKMEEK